MTKVDQYYSNHLAEMFSWDDKTSGTQVLMAQITEQGKYKDDAVKYFDYLMNRAQKTPKARVQLYRYWRKIFLV